MDDKEEFIDKSQQLTPFQVKAYAESRKRQGGLEYNNGTIILKDATPLGYMHAKQWIEDWHYESGRRLRTLRDCALGFMDGRIYNQVGDGEQEGIDALTKYVRAQRTMLKWHWALVERICIPNGKDRFGNDNYRISERDYPWMKFHIPSIKDAFDGLSTALDDRPKRV